VGPQLDRLTRPCASPGLSCPNSSSTPSYRMLPGRHGALPGPPEGH